MTMNWDYVAGLFDGDGHSNFIIRKPITKTRSWGVIPMIEIATSRGGLIPLRAFLMEADCFPQQRKDSYIIHGYNKTFGGISKCVRIGSWSGARVFANNILPRLYIKKPQMTLFCEAVNFRVEIANRDEKLRDYIWKFDEYRHAIHEYARKGNKELKEYDYPKKNRPCE